MFKNQIVKWKNQEIMKRDLYFIYAIIRHKDITSNA